MDGQQMSGGKFPMKASVLSFRAAVVMVVAGMIWGIVMAITEDHSTFPAHAHLNLLGWVSLFLFGIYYICIRQSTETTWLPCKPGSGSRQQPLLRPA